MYIQRNFMLLEQYYLQSKKFVFSALFLISASSYTMNMHYSFFSLPNEIIFDQILHKYPRSVCGLASTCKGLYQSYKYPIDATTIIVDLRTTNVLTSPIDMASVCIDQSALETMSKEDITYRDAKTNIFINLLLEDKVLFQDGSFNIRVPYVDTYGAFKFFTVLNQNKRACSFAVDVENVQDAEFTHVLTHYLSANTTIKCLTLRKNKLSEKTICSLANALKHNTALNILFLGKNKIEDAQVCILAEALEVNKTLEFLDLSENRIDNAGAEALAKMLKINRTLKVLSLMDNEISNSGARALASALKKNITLLSLNIDLNCITNGATLFADLLKRVSVFSEDESEE